MSTAYTWFQPGGITSAQSGCAIGVLKAFGTLDKTERIVGSDETGEGGGIRERSILRGRVKSVRLAFRAAAGHAPPSRAPKARAAYLRAFGGVRARFKGGDLNVLKRIATRALGRRVVGGGVLWLTIPRKDWALVNYRMVNVNGDHKAVLARVKHRKSGTVMTVLVINCMSVSTGPEHAANILAHGMRLDPDLILASECSDFRANVVDLSIHKEHA